MIKNLQSEDAASLEAQALEGGWPSGWGSAAISEMVGLKPNWNSSEMSPEEISRLIEEQPRKYGGWEC